ncbi:hypothetical protein D3C83_117140 [compost metagenome]
MGLAKIILLVLGLILVVWLVRSYRRRVDRSDNPETATQGENMVRCAHCGVHLPRSESLTTQGSYYCSAEHQRAHREGRSA